MTATGSMRGVLTDAGRAPHRLRLGKAGAVSLLAACLALSGCSNPRTPVIESMSQVDFSAKTPRKITTRGEGAVLKQGRQHVRYQLFPGQNTGLLEDGAEPAAGVGALDDGKFTVNVDQATVAEAAKLILGETLGFNYVLDPRVQGNITLVSNRPLSARELLSSFEAALRFSGASLLQQGGTYKIVSLQDILEGEMGQADMGKAVSQGYGVNVIPLRQIGAPAMMELLDSFMARSGSVRASKIGNLILIRGPAEERRALVDVVLSFDVDWMKTQSASIATLENGRADDVAAKLQAIFADDTAAAGTNALKIIPVARINGIIVIANSEEKLRRAVTWIRRLDQNSITDPNYYVYAVQNGNAVELAKILQATFGDGGADSGTTAEVAPDMETTQVSMDQAPAAPDQMSNPPADGQSKAGGQALGASLTTGSAPLQSGSAGTSTLANGTRITPNPANNTLVIRATPLEYRKIQAMLRQIDAPAVQVLINTTIAEVTLTDELRYGVQAYLKNNDLLAGFFGQSAPTDAATTTAKSLILKPRLPGMNVLLGGVADPQVVIDALSGITQVRVVSSPSVVVMENEPATIKVGDSVPVKVLTSTTDAGGTNNSFEYKDTGVILKVKPRVSANGMVTIELGQELSSAVRKDTANENANPTITQRTITSKVSVNDQQTVLLGGLISGSEEGNRSTVPGADKVPILGDLVGTTSKIKRRTELIIFMTPKIIRNGEEAAQESQDLRDKMRNLTFD